jgi:hypothetical protein
MKSNTLVAALLGAVAPFLGMMLAYAQVPVSVTLTVDPVEAVESATPTLTWVSEGAVTCEASGGWSGTKPVSGSETLPPIDRSTSYSLLCSAADGSAQLTWTPPAQYTNGAPLPLSDLGGFKIYHNLRGQPLDNVVDIPQEAATTYSLTGLTAGDREFAMTAYTDAGVESAQSNSVFKVVQVAASSAQADVSVLLKPEPPTIVTVESVVYEIKIHPVTQVASLGRQVGAIAYGVACIGEPVVTTGRGEYYEVPADLAYVAKPPKSDIIVARCAAIS